MGTPIKLGVCAGKMATLKTYLTGKDGTDYPLVPGFHLSLGRTCSGKYAWDWSGNAMLTSSTTELQTTLSVFFFAEIFVQPKMGPSWL